MKYFFLLLFCILFSTCYAMPCPNANGIVYKGDSIEEVLKQCGEPSEQITKINNPQVIKRLTYNSPHPYDQGYSEVQVLFNNDRVTNIHVFEHYNVYMCRNAVIQYGAVTTTQLSCGDWDFYTQNTGICNRRFGLGDTMEYVRSVCGEPVAEVTLPSKQNETTEFIYHTNGQQQTIIFQDGKVADLR